MNEVVFHNQYRLGSINCGWLQEKMRSIHTTITKIFGKIEFLVQENMRNAYGKFRGFTDSAVANFFFFLFSYWSFLLVLKTHDDMGIQARALLFYG